jgi:ATP phosphoribosyltransferase regulatory subunit
MVINTIADLVFAAYAGEHGDAIANGGRYDAIGKVFGRARPATGFDADLTVLMRLSTREFPDTARIFAPFADDDSLRQFINRLRSEGHIVIAGLRHQTETATQMQCSHEIIMSASGWLVKPVQN